ncbi:MAG: hypothetical protein C4B59_07430 [Candidatus Methanogaster sp.]|uniref:Uncharacterized protein n=1 Tax=Candidatus Methanogaster sp. TaxID=3386292 RepID=A0AC61L354_9EURY|nr:MAG: hypothetical protein C4B59_07430 [ANME-2 cluster archaeon]
MLKTYLSLESIARQFKEVVIGTEIFKLPSDEPAKLRIELIDGSFADVWISVSGRYSYHWNRIEVDGAIYRYDNAPHKVRASVATFPHHFHNRNEKTVIASDMPSTPEKQMEYFMDFIRKIMLQELP